jgi:hypothetical protein
MNEAKPAILVVELAESELQHVAGGLDREPVSYSFAAGPCTVTATGVHDNVAQVSIPTGVTISCREP